MKKRIARTCPICGQTYWEAPCISREDNCTEICPECGTRQSLEALNIPEDQIEHIIETIRKSTR